MASPGRNKFDAQLAAKLEEKRSNLHTEEFALLGHTWHLTNSGSVTVLLGAMDPNVGGGNVLPYILSLVVPDERQLLHDVLDSTEGLDGDLLLEIANEMTERISGFPTGPSSASPPSSRTRKSSAR